MKFIETLSKSFEGSKKLTNKATHDVDVIRQNRPPDERDVDAAEETADMGSTPSQSGAIGDNSEFPNNSKSRAKKAGGNS